MQNDLEVKEISIEDCERLPALLKRVWGKESDADYWKWKYFDAPFQTKGWIIEDPNKNVIAMAGSWYRPTKVGDRIFHPYMSVDTMADPDYRGGKVYGLLKDIMVAEGSENVLFGHVNPNSYKAFSVLFENTIRLDEDIPVLNAYVSIGEALPAPSLVKKVASLASKAIYQARIDSPDSQNVEIEMVTEVNEDFDGLWNQVSQEYWWIQDRSRKYLAWRYLQAPDSNTTIWAARDDEGLAGYMVSGVRNTSGKNSGYILDWLVPQARIDVFTNLLHTAVDALTQQQVATIETWLLPEQAQWIDVFGQYLLTPGKNDKRSSAVMS